MESNNSESVPRLISFNKFLEDLNLTSTTGWRWRKRGVIQTVNIYGRLYVSQDAIVDFHRRATAGEFAKEISPKKSGGIRERQDRPTGAGG
jgi:hypothetical protein